MKHMCLFLLLFGVLGISSGAEFKVAALHPLLGNMARQIGGEYVEVVDLLKPNGNLHSFEPSPKDVANASGARLVLASGKNMEPYLSSLGDSMKGGDAGCAILDLGAKIPDVPASEDEGTHGHDCDCGGHGPNDPHWWHTPSNMKRAARQIASEFTRIDPDHAAVYRENLTAWNKKMDRLNSWARVELAKVPEDRRVIAVGHAAMNHFCKEYGFKEVHIQGVGREDESNPAEMAALIRRMREEKINVIFPEYSSSPKQLEQIAHSLGVSLAGALITDGLSSEAPDFETMFKRNVETIVNGLTGKR